MNGDGAREGGAGSKSDEADLAARLKRLEDGLEGHRSNIGAAKSRGEPEPSGPSPLGRAFRLSTEFVAGVAAGGLLGWGFDHLVGTRPWGMIVFLMLGFAAGIYNVMRASGFLTPPSGPPTT